MHLGWAETEMTITKKIITINSGLLKREVTCTILMPDEKEIAGPLSLLLMNDGQELENLGLSQTLEQLYNTNRIKPLVVVAIHAGEDRLQEYGVAGRSDFKSRGARADLYTQFIITELLPQLKDYTGINEFESTAFAGFSLGGLSAFDIGWNNADIFDKVGVFSGSFWWRSKDLTKGYTDNDRIAHALVRETAGKPDLKFWLQTGTKDETSDRNKNGIIDAIDDTIDLVKELEVKGYSRPDSIQYVEVVGGNHNAETWGKVMGKFLSWAFGR
jgi:enterochelin esterase family protein